MKNKKLSLLYIAMIVVGLALLFSNSSSPPDEPPIEQQVVIRESKKEIVTVAVAKHDISEKTILTKSDYYFKSMEVTTGEEKNKYITDIAEIDAYVAKVNIAKDTVIEASVIASPNSEDYMMLALKDGNYMFPFAIREIDSYLTKNLKGGDLVDLYMFYGDETEKSPNTKQDILISPSVNFTKNRIKPIIVGKRILYINTKKNSKLDENFDKNEVEQVQLELTNQEIKLLRTLMTNSTIIMYPSIYEKSVDDGLRLLNDKERNWPLTDKDIFSGTRINLLKGR